MSGATWIARWNEAAAHWSAAMWRSCWQGGLFALLIWLICQQRRRVPATMRYGLWWLVCLKLAAGLCPVFLTLPLLPPVSNVLPAAATRPVAPLQTTTPPVVRLPAAPLQATADGTARAQASLPTAAWLMGVWLIAIGALLGLSAISFRRLLRLVRQAEPLSDAALLSLAREVAAAMGVRSVPRILVAQVDVGVLTLGLWRPIVLLSQQTLDCCTPSELRLVLAHECAHIRRGDAWLGLLPQLTQILFCFYPLAWLACREVDLSREVACDEQTLCALQARSDDYGRLLLKLGAQHKSWLSLCTPGVSSHFRVLHRRLSMLQQMTDRSPRRLRGRALMLMCLIGVTVAAPWSLVHAQNPVPNVSGSASQTQIVAKDSTASGVRQTVTDGNAQNRTTTAVATRVRPQTGATIPAAAKDRTFPTSVRTKQAAQVIAKLMTADPRNRSLMASAARSADAKSGSEGGRTELTGARIIPARPDPEPRPETRLFKLRYAQADVLAKTLDALFEAPAPNSTKILADARTNTVIVQANAQRLLEIANVLTGLDVPSAHEDKARTFTNVFPLKYARATDLARTLTVLFADKSDTIKITADDRTNALIVHGENQKINELNDLIRQIDINHK